MLVYSVLQLLICYFPPPPCNVFDNFHPGLWSRSRSRRVGVGGNFGYLESESESAKMHRLRLRLLLNLDWKMAGLHLF